MKRFKKVCAAVLLAILPTAPAAAQSDWYGVEDYCPIYLNLVIDEIPLSEIMESLHDNISPYSVTAFLDGVPVAETSDLMQAGEYRFFILKVPGTAADVGKDITFQVYREGGSETFEPTDLSVKFTLESIGEPSNPLILSFKTENYGHVHTVEPCDTIYIGRGKTIEIVKEMVRVTPANAQYEIADCYAVFSDDIIEVSGHYITALERGTTEVEVSIQDIAGNWFSVYIPVVVVVAIEDFKIFDQEITLYTDESLNWATMKTMWRISPSDAKQSVTLESSDNNVFRIDRNEKGEYTIYPVSKGSATLTVRTADPDFYGDIRVNVVSAPEYVTFDTEKLVLDGRESRSLTVTFMPEDCRFDKIRMSYEIVNADGVPEDWCMIDMDGGTVDGRQITYNISSYSSGSSTLRIYHRDVEMGSLPVSSSTAVDLTDGWSWMSVPDADILKSDASIKELLGNVLVEARTQNSLWINDPEYGIVGTGTSMAGKCVKMNLENTAGLSRKYLSFQAVERKDEKVGVSPGWTWMSYPYEYEYTLDVLDGYMNWSDKFRKGTMIVSKADGFVTLDEYGEWQGTLESLKPGQGYMLFNAGETCIFTWISEYTIGQPISFETEEEMPFAQTRGGETVDHSRFSDNMCVIAQLPDDIPAGTRLAAYVDGELRGTATAGIDGMVFLTVHGKAGERVTFSTGDSFMFSGSLEFRQAAGTLDRPFRPDRNTESQSVYDIWGRRLDSCPALESGLYIIDGRKMYIR